jgi:hypothetical protein
VVWEQAIEDFLSHSFSIAQQPDAWVADRMQYQDGRLQWDVIFTRPVQDWEMEMVLSFFEQLYSHTQAGRR